MEVSGDVMVLNMGKPIKIVDVAISVLKSMNLEIKTRHSGDIPIYFTGLQKGEKLTEELYNEDLLLESKNNKIIKELVYLKQKDNNYIFKIKKLINNCQKFSNKKFKEKLKYFSN